MELMVQWQCSGNVGIFTISDTIFIGVRLFFFHSMLLLLELDSLSSFHQPQFHASFCFCPSSFSLWLQNPKALTEYFHLGKPKKLSCQCLFSHTTNFFSIFLPLPLFPFILPFLAKFQIFKFGFVIHSTTVYSSTHLSYFQN